LQLDGAGPVASAQAAEQVRLHAASDVAEHLDHPRVGVAVQATLVPQLSGLLVVAVPDDAPRHAAVAVAFGNDAEDQEPSEAPSRPNAMSPVPVASRIGAHLTW